MLTVLRTLLQAFDVDPGHLQSFAASLASLDVSPGRDIEHRSHGSVLIRKNADC